MKASSRPQRAASGEVSSKLAHVHDGMPGLRRVRSGKGFSYRDPDGRSVRDAATLGRIRRLAIPPAYTSVWICATPHGHLQATGRDARGRKQYRYHQHFRELQEHGKFERLVQFGRVLPRIRARVMRDLDCGPKRATPAREQVVATVVRLLDATCVRVGNDEYARENGSFGLTTLHNRHAAVQGNRLRLSFKGKSGVPHDVSIDDPKVAAVVRRCQELPGQSLFEYHHESGEVRAVGSADVNDYLSEAAGARFTAKDFRTWHGSVLALELARGAAAEGKPVTAKHLKAIVAGVAAQLRNTAAVCRKSYIHPAVLAFAGSACQTQWQMLCSAGASKRGLKAAELRLLRFMSSQARGSDTPGAS